MSDDLKIELELLRTERARLAQELVKAHDALTLAGVPAPEDHQFYDVSQRIEKACEERLLLARVVHCESSGFSVLSAEEVAAAARTAEHIVFSAAQTQEEVKRRG